MATLVLLSELEPVKEWYVTNPFVGGGYRSPRSYMAALSSAFEWHNETLNIYSHLLPGLAWMYMLFSCGQENYYLLADSNTQYLICFAYFAAAFMGIASGCAHTFHIVDRRWATAAWNCDMVGIILVNLSHQLLDSFILIPKSSVVFPVAIFLECAVACICIRDIIMGSSSIHWGIIYPLISSTMPTLPVLITAITSTSPLIREIAFCSIGCSVFVCIAGGVFFIGRVPERFWNPGGRMDNFNSHVWHHLCIVAAILCAHRAIPLLVNL